MGISVSHLEAKWILLKLQYSTCPYFLVHIIGFPKVDFLSTVFVLGKSILTFSDTNSPNYNVTSTVENQKN